MDAFRAHMEADDHPMGSVGEAPRKGALGALLGPLAAVPIGARLVSTLLEGSHCGVVLSSSSWNSKRHAKARFRLLQIGSNLAQ